MRSKTVNFQNRGSDSGLINWGYIVWGVGFLSSIILIPHAMCEHVDSYPGDCWLIEIDGFVLYLSTPDKPGCNPRLCKIFAPALKWHRAVFDLSTLLQKVTNNECPAEQKSCIV